MSLSPRVLAQTLFLQILKAPSLHTPFEYITHPSPKKEVIIIKNTAMYLGKMACESK